MVYTKSIEFSLGYNFDPWLIDEVNNLNCQFGKSRRIAEFFGALPFGPYLSTRPMKRIPNPSWYNFECHIKRMKEYGIYFNYLFNAILSLKQINFIEFNNFLRRLFEIGINRLIVYSPELCRYIKTINSNFEITISSVYNIRSKEQLDEAHQSGADYAYLDSIFINRNFKLLRELKNQSRIPLKLYANISCLSQCPNKDFHYSVLSNQDCSYQLEMNDKLFEYCSLEKLTNPVSWIQMQWIRPEDIDIYFQEGFNHFKLTDRLSPTSNLVFIAEHYLKCVSPNNLFPLFERNGSKYERLYSSKQNQYEPLYIDNIKIPVTFIDHFKSDNCDSTNMDCNYCNNIAKHAVKSMNVNLIRRCLKHKD